MIRHARQNGPFVRHCPCSPDTVSCGYHNIDLEQGCPFSCNYCILQAYLQDSNPVSFTNIEDLRLELESMRSLPHLRLGTGELADSLALDPDTGLSKKILEIFADFPRMVFEFKTKSVEIGHLIAAPKVLPNVVVGWSLNPDTLCRGEELGAPALGDRLEAMAAVADKGYRVGIHFDPMIAVPGWEELYPDLVDKVTRRIPGDRLAWWSLGTLRFPPSMREIILSKPGSRLFSGELVRGYDGKYRYFRPLRRRMFRVVSKHIRSRLSPQVPLYLCMEDKAMWSDVFPGRSVEEEEVNADLYRAALR